MAKFSDNYATIDKNTIGRLAGELDSLADLFANHTYRLIRLKTGRIGVCADILTKANSKSCLHRVEPVVIVLDYDNWQDNPPFVFPDRIGFPHNNLPHVFYEGDNYPAGLCLIRENLRDWYSEHTLKDYVARLNEWMQDAARNNLIKLQSKDEYEPQRYLSSKIEATFYRVFSDDTSLERQHNPSCHFSSLSVFNDTNIAFGSDENGLPSDNALCIRLFRGSKAIDNEWFVSYPKTIGDLYALLAKKGYPFDIQEVLPKLDDSKDFVFFMIALLRSSRIIGKDSKINYLCFRAKSSDIIHGNTEAHIDEVLIRDYPNLTTARNLSLTPKSICGKRIAILGCGAIGSKIALHLYRSGVDRLTLVDNDILEPHNMCRHALLCSPLDKGRKKVELLKEALNGLFFGVPNQIETSDKDAITFLKETDLNQLDLVIDATASASVMHGIDAIRFPSTTKVIRTCLSQGGDIGIAYITTGSKRLQSDYYSETLLLAISDDDISNWLKQEKKNSLEAVRVGEGCHSYTMKISDDTISSHAALMSSLIRHIDDPKSKDGIMLSFANDLFPGSMGTSWYEAPDYCELSCDNDNDWHIRLPQALLNSIRLNARAHRDKETGGYLFGHTDYKRKLIYVVTDFIPDDSRQQATQLELSKKGFHQFDKKVTERTAGQIYYIGDWHSHPSYPLIMSEIDVDTCRNRVLPAMRGGVGICIITKATATKVFLVSDRL